MKDLAIQLNNTLQHRPAEEILKTVNEHFRGKICFASSLGYEDQAIAHIISVHCPDMPIFTLDTGRLFPETYDLIDRTNSRLKVNIHVYFPDAKEVEEMVAAKGINLFYDSIEKRKLCCAVRKTHPLRRALADRQAWVTGLRRAQSVTRFEMQAVEWDETNQLIKINPLIYWTDDQVVTYVKAHNIPYHPLHDKGFPSIGCQPCTRAILPGEDIRAGRWWWENPDQKECGLHKK